MKDETRDLKIRKKIKKTLTLLVGGDLAPNLGETKKFFRGPISGKISIFRVKISDDLFLVIDLVLRIFPTFSVCLLC